MTNSLLTWDTSYLGQTRGMNALRSAMNRDFSPLPLVRHNRGAIRRKAFLLCILTSFQFILGSFASASEVLPVAVPTFECIGLYWKAPEGRPAAVCDTKYRLAGASEWKQALPLWFDERNREYRGSIVNLQPGAKYDISLQVRGTPRDATLQANTWSEIFPVARKTKVPEQPDVTFTINESGSADGFVLYENAASGSVIDVAGNADHCIVVKASYVILRGLTLKGARVHGIFLSEGVHDVVIEQCDISGWGRVDEDGWGKDYDAAIYSRGPGVKRIIIQGNRIHHPRSNSNNWQQARPRPGKTESSHPEGPQAVCLWDSEGNHVIRYNTVWSDEDHQYNDVFGAGHNFSTRGFPNRDSDIYANLLSHCWDDAIESEGANCNVRIWGNYITDAFVGVACASTSIGPLYVWRNITGVIRESPTKIAGAFLKTSNKMGGGRIFVFHNTILQPASATNPAKTSGAVVGLGWGGPMTNVTSRNNILHVTRQVIADRAQDPRGDYDYDLFNLDLNVGTNQEKHGLRGVPIYVPASGAHNSRGIFAMAQTSPGLDAGAVLPNFNDGFAGRAPDIGAHEAGAPPMEFGGDAFRTRGARYLATRGSADASAATAPYRHSTLITALKWDDSVFKLKTAAGDNWPITWAEGDLQITAWGDGPGFDERPPRLSLGFARVWGDPPNLRAEDFSSDADTPHGGGSSAIKASGLLLVDGTLYMWVRNYRPPGSDDFTNARLAWSKDQGAHWTWADWHFADTFGCPEFVQFGPNYSGARDRFVYIVSQANDSAYGYSPEIVMARVPQGHVAERERYEFFAGLESTGEPRWSKNLDRRKPTFTDPHGTQRVAVTYNRGLKRYLLTTSHQPEGSQATHTPALGVFDAPEPWGPWTTVSYESHWSGTNRTYHHKFPTKWMSADGRTAWLLYSGLDGGLYTFCLKKATLEVAP